MSTQFSVSDHVKTRGVVWNLFLLKRGWRDSGSAGVAAEKQARGFADRADIQTYVDMHDAEEGRDPLAVLG